MCYNTLTLILKIKSKKMHNNNTLKNFTWLKNNSIKILISCLKSDNHEFKFVGGALRDSLIKKPFADYDIASNNSPEANIELLKKQNILSLPTGLKHGTITAVINREHFEITSLRRDISNDGRHAEVEFTGDFFEDSKRRDFTFNALYLDPISLEITDYHNGVKDLKNKKINFIGNPQDRIDEDYLRILRYFRFLCGYASNTDEDVLEIIKYKSSNLKSLSKERINQEISKLLLFPSPTKTLNLMLKYNVFDSLFDVDRYSILKFDNLLETEQFFKLSPNLNLRVAFMLNKPEVVSDFILKSADSKAIKSIISLKTFIQQYKVVSYTEVCELIIHYGYDTVINALIVASATEYNNKYQYIEVINKLVEKSKKDFPLTGHDLISLGLKDEQIGIYMQKIKLMFWQTSLKTKEEYIEIIKRWIRLERL